MAVRGWAIAGGASFAFTIVLSIVGSILQARGVASPAVKATIVAAVVVAFVVIAAAIPPLALRYFLAGQTAIGNGELPIIAFMLRHEAAIVRGTWVLMAAGAAIALPHVLRDLGWRV